MWFIKRYTKFGESGESITFNSKDNTIFHKEGQNYGWMDGWTDGRSKCSMPTDLSDWGHKKINYNKYYYLYI